MNVLNVVAKDSLILFGFEDDNFKHQEYSNWV